MTETPQLSGRDLARQALAAYRATAKTAPPADRKPRRTRATRVTRGTGRDPMGLGGILQQLGEQQGWDTGLGGGSIIDQWTTLCPTALVNLLTPAGYDPERRLLTLRPAHPAAATQARLIQHQLIQHLNTQLGQSAVQSIRVLPPGVGQAGPKAEETYSTPAAEEPRKPRKPAPAGYRAAIEAARTHRPEHQPTDPYVLEAMQRQEAALRANRQPETEDPEAHWVQADAQQGPRPGSVEASLRAARAYKRREQACRNAPRRTRDVA